MNIEFITFTHTNGSRAIVRNDLVGTIEECPDKSTAIGIQGRVVYVRESLADVVAGFGCTAKGKSAIAVGDPKFASVGHAVEAYLDGRQQANLSSQTFRELKLAIEVLKKVT